MPAPTLRHTRARLFATADQAGPASAAVFPEPDHPAWMTWAQRAVHRHRAFHGRMTIPIDPDGCWTWLGCTVKDGGYGRVTWAGKARWAHRLSRLVAFGDEPAAVCHTCDNPPCVNPEHLRSGTLSDNTAEMWAKGRNALMNRLTPEQAVLVAAAARAGLGRRGSRRRIEEIGARYGVSYRTVYRLATGRGLPKVYARALEAVA